MFQIPNVYRPPLGLPLNWRDEQSGALSAAILAYLDNRIKGTVLTDEQFDLVKDFVRHYIGAPCWNHMLEDEELATELATLRHQVLYLKTPDDLGAWIHQCLDVGLDPL